MRIFFALWPPPATARVLAEWARGAQALTGGRTTDEAKIHLTLAFLGDADPVTAAAAARRVEARRHALPIEQAHRWREGGIVWVGPRDTPPALTDLVEGLNRELYRAEFILERRPFAAHVTLLRKARPAKLPALPALEWPVDEFVLVRSSLSAAGSSYEALERFSLSRAG